MRKGRLTEVDERSRWAKDIREKGIWETQQPKVSTIDPFELMNSWEVREFRKLRFLISDVKKQDTGVASF